MTTSGTWAFNLDIAEIIEEAYENIGVEVRSGYDYRTARRSLDLLLLEWQNRGLNLWTIKSTTQALTAGVSAYALSGEKVDVIEAMLRTGTGTAQFDTRMTRISVSSYAQLATKNMQGQPTQFFVSRTPTAITLNLWPVPDAAQTYTLAYYYMEQIEDTGVPGSNNVDIPARHLPALISGLAYYLSMKVPGKLEMAPMLKQVYEDQWTLAADTVRDKSALYLRPAVYS